MIDNYFRLYPFIVIEERKKKSENETRSTEHVLHYNMTSFMRAGMNNIWAK